MLSMTWIRRVLPLMVVAALLASAPLSAAGAPGAVPSAHPQVPAPSQQQLKLWAAGLDLPLPNVIVETTAIADELDGQCDLYEALMAVFQANYGLSPTHNDCTAKVDAMNIIAFGLGTAGSTITIPATGLSQLPMVYGTTVILGPIALQGSPAPADTHIFRTAPGASVTIVAVTVKNTHTAGAGPAILATSQASVNVVGSFFINNDADSDGGAIDASGDLNLMGTSFIGNHTNSTPGTGGAVFVSGAGAFKSEASTFTGNKASAGGAIYLQKSGGEAAINDSIFTGNIVSGDANDFGGGAVYNYGGKLEVQRSAFNANLGLHGQGGALVNNTGATAWITNTLFDGNFSGDVGVAMDGGAIKNLGQLNVGRSTFVGNYAQGGSGGAIALASGSQVSIANTTFSANQASELGGALLITGTAAAVIRNSTLANNSAGTAADAIYAHASAQAQIGNTLIDHGAGLKSSCFSAGITTLGHNLDSDSSCNLTSGSDLHLPPLLNGLSFNGGALPVLTTHKPDYFSPAVDHGDNAICADPAVENEDEVGTKRPKDPNHSGVSACDIGAVEVGDRAPAFSAMPMPPGPLNFGSVQVNHTLTVTLMISNTGSYLLTLAAPTVGDTAHFQLVSGFTSTLAVGGQATLVLGCQPSAAGPLASTFSFTTSDADHATVDYTLLCSGTAVPQPAFASLPVAPAPINFGDVANAQTVTRTLTLKNLGPSPTQLNINAALTGSGDLHTNLPASFTVVAGAPQSYWVTCRPTAQPGLLAGVLHLTTNDPAQPAVDFNVTCNGLPPESAYLGNSENLSGAVLPADLTGAWGVALSPDDRDAYLTGGSTAGGQVVLLHKSTSGLFAGQYLWTNGGASSSLLSGAHGVAVSPDGRFVLVAGASNNTLTVYQRNADDGSLVSLGYFVNGSVVSGMAYPWDIAFSPDGKFVYVSGYSSNSIAIFRHDDTITGHFGFNGQIAVTTMTTHTLQGPNDLVVSPDGKNLYVAAANTGSGTGVLAVYQRNLTTGGLTPLQTRYYHDCQDATGPLCLMLDGLNGAYQVAVSPDGKSVYVTGQANDALATFRRDPISGAVHWAGTFKNGVNGVTGLAGTRGVAVSPNNRRVYVLGATDQALAVFDRDPYTSALTFSQVFKRNNGTATPKLAGAAELAVSSDGETLLATAATDNALVGFRKANPVPSLSSLQPASVAAGGADFTLVVKGAGFAPGAAVWWDSYQAPTTYVNATELHATIRDYWYPAVGAPVIMVHNPGLDNVGGGDSFNTLTFQITTPAGPDVTAETLTLPIPTIDHLTPAAVKAGAADTLVDVYGASFQASTVVLVNGASRPVTFVDSAHVRVLAGAASLAQPGTVIVQATNGASADSNLAGLEVTAPGKNPTPSLTSLSPTWAYSYGAASSDLNVVVTGVNFVDGAAVQVNGDNRPTAFIDRTHLRVTLYGLDALSPGGNSLTVANPTPGGGVSNLLTFTVAQLHSAFMPLMHR